METVASLFKNQDASFFGSIPGQMQHHDGMKPRPEKESD
jgi:hypothetical protein